MRGTVLRRTLLAVIAVIAVLASGVLIAGATTAPKPKEMKVACASKANGVLRYVARASRCKSNEKAITLDVDNPIDICVKLHGTLNGVAGSLGQLRAARLPAGSTRMSPPADCPRQAARAHLDPAALARVEFGPIRRRGHRASAECA